MTRKICDTKPVIEFIGIASEYCHLIENRDEIPTVSLIRQALTQLLKLYLAVTRLPEISKISGYSAAGMPDDEWMELFWSLQRKLDDYDFYSEVFDPYDRKKTKAIPHSLSDDLADIFRALKPALNDWVRSTSIEKRDIIWEWKFGFATHWGRHLTEAIRAIYCLLFEFITDENGDYVGFTEQ